MIFARCLQLVLPAQVSVKELASLLGASTAEVEDYLVSQLGETVASKEDAVSPEAAELVALEWGRVAVVQDAGKITSTSCVRWIKA